MAKSLDAKVAKLSKKRRSKIEARAAELIAEELSMRDLRKALELTQRKVAEKLDISQDNVSRLEARSDVLISTLRAYVRAIGGDLRLVAEFPDRPPVFLAGLSALAEDKTTQARKQKR